MATEPSFSGLQNVMVTDGKMIKITIFYRIMMRCWYQERILGARPIISFLISCCHLSKAFHPHLHPIPYQTIISPFAISLQPPNCNCFSQMLDLWRTFQLPPNHSLLQTCKITHCVYNYKLSRSDVVTHSLTDR